MRAISFHTWLVQNPQSNRSAYHKANSNTCKSNLSTSRCLSFFELQCGKLNDVAQFELSFVARLANQLQRMPQLPPSNLQMCRLGNQLAKMTRHVSNPIGLIFMTSIFVTEAELHNFLCSNTAGTFFCGESWAHADETCMLRCPSGNSNDCPA